MLLILNFSKSNLFHKIATSKSITGEYHLQAATMIFLEPFDNIICFILFSFVTFLWFSGEDFSFIMFTVYRTVLVANSCLLQLLLLYTSQITMHNNMKPIGNKNKNKQKGRPNCKTIANPNNKITTNHSKKSNQK